ncbi:hypothetical protein SLS53_009343 [Cytospora paraplurivora]|uniref:SRR1-like domain-containing protein n=1 Tax=Cytospora paraplurivora TaxID=2898453 RepID=A0AAN9TWU5_9PEZI
MEVESNFDPGHFKPGRFYGLQSQPAVEYYSEIGSYEDPEILGQVWERRLDDAHDFVRSVEAGDRIYKLEDLSYTMVQIKEGREQVELVDIKGNRLRAANLTIRDHDREKTNPGKFIQLVPWQFKIRLAQSWKRRDIREYIPEKRQMDCFVRTEEDFRGGSQYKDLLSRLREERSTRNLDDRIQITKIVCFALGSPVRMDIGLPQEPRILRQHVLAMALREEFGASACYTQDPEYSTTDKNILSQKGMRVVEDPDGFREIDNDSLVFFINPNTDIWAIMADNCRPAIIICYPEVPNGRLPAYDRGALGAVVNLEDHGKYKAWIEKYNPELQYQKRVRYMAHREYDQVILTDIPGGILPEHDVNHPILKHRLIMYVRKPETRWDPETWRKREWLEEFTG